MQKQVYLVNAGSRSVPFTQHLCVLLMASHASSTASVRRLDPFDLTLWLELQSTPSEEQLYSLSSVRREASPTTPELAALGASAQAQLQAAEKLEQCAVEASSAPAKHSNVVLEIWQAFPWHV